MFHRRETKTRSCLADLVRGRVVVVVAHPDDEVLGCGALLAELGDVRIVHVTDGAPASVPVAQEHGFEAQSGYAAARRQEAAAALSLVDLRPERIVCLEVVDQEAVRCMVQVARRLRPILSEADVVLTHAFEGGHPDHDAVALAVHAACRLGPTAPTLVEMPFYHAGPEGWVRQRFLPRAGAGDEVVLRLDADQRALKRRMMDAHVTQAGVLASFSNEAERFRFAPTYDFDTLPHTGDLLYERHGWGLTGQIWMEQASAALADLGW